MKTIKVLKRFYTRVSLDWGEDDHAVVDETLIGRISKQRVYPNIKWSRLLQTVPAPPPNEGVADTIEEAKAELTARYEQVKRGE